MLTKSIVVMLLSLPASVALLGVLMAVTPAHPEKTLPGLLLFFPLWILVATAAFVVEKKRVIAGGLVALTIVGVALITLFKSMGWDGLRKRVRSVFFETYILGRASVQAWRYSSPFRRVR